MILDTQLSLFEKKIEFVFKNKKLLIQAFTHRSFINEHQKSGLSHNERLEFLGDAVLELVVTDFLYSHFKNKSEGELTAHRAALVNAVTLSEVASDLKMNELLLLSKGESRDTGKARAVIMADVIEALIGAIYLESGYPAAADFIKKFLLSRLDEIISRGLLKDAKSKIQEKAQEVFGVTPSYKILKQTGPDHDKEFVVGIYFGVELVAQGEGKSKQEAEQKAASAALEVRGL